MPAQFRPPFEIWGNVQAAGGVRIGFIPEAQEADESKQLDGHDLTIDLAMGYVASPNLQEGRIIRSVWSDGTFDEWRIQSFRVERKESGSLVARLSCNDPRVALGDVLVYRTEADGTHTYSFSQTLPASEHLSKFILPALAAEGYTWVAAGTVSPTQPIELAYDFSTALAAVQALAQALNVEFDFRRNGTTQYLIDLVTQIGSGATPLLVRYARNLTGFTKIPAGGEIATRVIPRGADEGGIRATMGRAQWKVTAVDTVNDDVTLADPLGGDGPILEDDQFNGKYLRRVNGTLDAIVDTFAASQKIRVADASFYAVNDLVEFRRTSGGELLDFVESPLYGVSPPTGYGLRTKVLDRPDLSGTVNLITNPAMRIYTGASNAAPDNWKVIPGSGLSVNDVDKETSAAFWRVGGQSAKIVAGGDGQGIETDYIAISPTDASPYYSGYGGFWNDTDGARVRVVIVFGIATVSISGTPTRATSGGVTTVSITTSAAHGLAEGDLTEILGLIGGTTADGYNGIQKVSRVVSSTQFEYQLSADPGTVSVSSPTMRKVWRFVTTGNPASKTWVDYAIEGLNAKELAATVAKIQVMQDGTTAATFYADRAQLTQTATQRAFIEGNGPTRLWQEATTFLRSNRQPPTRYDVNLLDLGRIDPAIWPYDNMTLGGSVSVADPDVPLGISTRIVGVKRKPLVDGATSLELSTKFDDLTDTLARPSRPPKGDFPAAPAPQRNVRTISIPGGKFTPLTSTDATKTKGFYGGSDAFAVDGGDDASAQAAVTDDLLARGGIIVAMRVKSTVVGAGSVTVILYRDGSPISTIANTTSPITRIQSDTLVRQLLGGENYLLRADLVSGTSSALIWVELDIEIPVTAGSFISSTLIDSVVATGSVTSRSIANRLAEVRNVLDFGAVGDGVADDTAAINLALSAPGVIMFPPGTYKTTAPLTPTAGTKIRGAGHGLSIIKKAHTGNLMTVGSVSNFEVDQITLDADVGTSTTYAQGAAIRMNAGTDNPVIRNVQSLNIDIGLDIDADAAKFLACSDCVFDPFTQTVGSEGRVVYLRGTDTNAMHRKFTNLLGQGIVDLGAIFDTLFVNCITRRWVWSSASASITSLVGCVFGSLGTAITINGSNTSVIGCRMAADVTLSSGMTGACSFIGNFQTAGTFTNNTNFGVCLVQHHPLGAGYHKLNQHTLSASNTTEEIEARRVSTNQGDANVTLTLDQSPRIVRFNTALTANRTVTLPTGRDGYTYRIVRQASATGAFTLTAGPVVLSGPGQWADVMWDGPAGAWIATAYGIITTSGAFQAATMGIGVAPPTADSLVKINTTLAAGGTTQFGQITDVDLSSSATATGVGQYVKAGAPNSAFTMASLICHYIASPRKGAAATVTTAYGQLIEDVTVGGTNYAIKTGLGRHKFGGCLILPYRSVSGNTTLDETDYSVDVDATSAGVTITLPAASGRSGMLLNIRKTDASANQVTVDANASELIDGATTFVLIAQYESILIRCDGAGWGIL